MARPVNELRQVRNYIRNNFTKEEQKMFDFLVESFPEHIITQGLVSEIDTSKIVESINRFAGDKVILTADNVMLDERAGISIEDALLESLYIEDYEEFGDKEIGNTVGGTYVGTVNSKDGDVVFTAQDLPFTHFDKVEELKGDEEGSSRTVENFIDNYFIFDDGDEGLDTRDVYKIGDIGDIDLETDVLSINNLTGRVGLHARSIYYGDESEKQTIREILYDILSLEGVGETDNIGNTHLVVEEAQDVLLLLAILGKLLGGAKEKILNLKESKNFREVLNKIKKGSMSEFNKTLAYFNYIETPFEIVEETNKTKEGIYEELFEGGGYFNLLEISLYIMQLKGTKLGLELVLKKALLDFKAQGEDLTLSSIENSGIEISGKAITYKIPSGIQIEKKNKLISLLTQLKPAGYTQTISGI